MGAGVAGIAVLAPCGLILPFLRGKIHTRCNRCPLMGKSTLESSGVAGAGVVGAGLRVASVVGVTL